MNSIHLIVMSYLDSNYFKLILNIIFLRTIYIIMEYNIDLYINLLRNLSNSGSVDGELSEQGEAAPSGGGGGTTAGYPKVPKWEEFYQTKRGKGNMLGKAGEKWTTGLTRGLANQIW